MKSATQRVSDRQVVDINVTVLGEPARGSISLTEIAHRITVRRGRESGRLRFDFPAPFTHIQILDGQVLTPEQAREVRAAIEHLISIERPAHVDATLWTLMSACEARIH